MSTERRTPNPRAPARLTARLRARIARPTRRGWAVFGLAVVFYLFANQTQVSWLYLFAALALGVWLASAGAPGRMLRGLTLARWLDDAPPAAAADREHHVGEAATVTLELRNPGGQPAVHIRGLEVCPFAPAADREQPFFVSAPARGSVRLSYSTLFARRGWFEFPPLRLSCRAPFGFFTAERALAAPTGVLVFPEYRVLQRFPLLDRRPAVQNPLAAVGPGSEFVGVREYRPGDPPRHVHWRSTARAGRLVVKEFAEETRPGLTILLDVRASVVIGAAADDTLERAIRAAATLVHYADGRGLSVTLASNHRDFPAPPGPLSRWAAMNYLARLPAAASGPDWDELVRGLPPTVFLAALLPAPDEAAVAPLVGLKRQGVEVLAVLIDPADLAPGWMGRAEQTAGALRAGGVNVRVLGGEPDWERALVADDRAAVRW